MTWSARRSCFVLAGTRTPRTCCSTTAMSWGTAPYHAVTCGRRWLCQQRKCHGHAEHAIVSCTEDQFSSTMAGIEERALDVPCRHLPQPRYLASSISRSGLAWGLSTTTATTIQLAQKSCTSSSWAMLSSPHTRDRRSSRCRMGSCHCLREAARLLRCRRCAARAPDQALLSRTSCTPLRPFRSETTRSTHGSMPSAHGRIHGDRIWLSPIPSRPTGRRP